jgi:hypothetical protein
MIKSKAFADVSRVQGKKREVEKLRSLEVKKLRS